MDALVLGIIFMAVLAIGGAWYIRVLYRSLERQYARHDDEVPVKIQWLTIGLSFCMVAPPLFYMGYLITLLIG